MMNLKSNILTGSIIILWIWSQMLSQHDDKSTFSNLMIFIVVPILLTITGFVIDGFLDQMVKFGNTTSKLFALGSALIFLLSGITFLLSSNSTIDIQLHDTYYVFFNHHTLIFFSIVLGIFAILYSFLTRLFKGSLSQILSQIHFWMTTLGVLFFIGPLHLLGVTDVPRLSLIHI